ncbi:hypothetical protein [Nonomuraea sp. SYSU D8015]|uniref:hypothetical protein n=1 Tax=Nonomuraea sp. SYSU D8015 TaxID=2593644 RepID=UPI0016612292|nr:hypothetical protein [Nonomuraea sp. SYSU D8015]
MKRMLAVLAVVLAALAAGTVPAGAAGNWAVTYMDPLPDRFESGKPYVLGFWVLQHGSHPFSGRLGPVGLRLTGEGGKSLMFNGTALPEAGHYATSVVVPEGEWKVEGMQGIFQPYDVGTLVVPGGLKLNPVEKEAIASFVSYGRDYWDEVRPPGFPDLAGATVKVDTGEVAAEAGPAAPREPVASPRVTAVPAARESGGVPAYTLLIAAAGGALLAAAALRWLPLPRRRREDEPDQPSGTSSETIVVSG